MVKRRLEEATMGFLMFVSLMVFLVVAMLILLILSLVTPSRPTPIRGKKA